MTCIYFNLNFFTLISIIFKKINKKNKIYYIHKSKFINYFFNSRFFSILKIDKFDWDFNKEKEGKLLLGYKVEIDYLNDFVNNFTDNQKYLSKNKNVKLFFKKDLLFYRIFNKVTLFELLYTCIVIKKKFNNPIIYLPKINNDQFFIEYFNKNYELKINCNNEYLKYFYFTFKDLLIKLLKILKNNFHYINYNKIFKKNTYNPIISIELPINSFKPQDYFNNLNTNDLNLVNKIHKLSNFDKENLNKSKKNFVPLYKYGNKTTLSNLKKQIQKEYDLNYFNTNNVKFLNEFLLWYNYFSLSNTKLYITNYKYFSHVIAASEAIKKLNGVSCMIQGSFYEKTNPYGLIVNDIYFSFSNKYNYAEQLIGSRFRYNISVGYIYDYKFNLSKKNSIKIRNKILQNGAKKIVAFFDQGAVSDQKLTAGFYHIRDSYKFILSKLLDNDWMGLIIKPKKPAQLKNSLGPIYELLLKAVKTGRCHVYLNSDEILVKNFENSPSEAAFGSDIAIHNCLVAGTAGLESAMTNTETLYYDYFGFEESMFYKYENKIVFNNWDNLWFYLQNRLKEYKSMSNGWKMIQNDLDPFMDGKSFDRIEEFSKDILINFKKNKTASKDDIIDQTVKNYVNKWGEDKVLKYEISN